MKKKLLIISIFFLFLYFLNINLNLDKYLIKVFLFNGNNSYKLQDINKKKVNKITYLMNYQYKDFYKSNMVLLENDNNKPLIYLYNTHPTEKYKMNNHNEYNISPSVITVNYILQEYLNNKGYKTIVEEKKVSDVLNKKNLNYAYSYVVSRDFLKEASVKNPSLKYFIDIHRDSVSKNITTVTINKKKYARILFIIGLENNKYKKNLIITKYLNDEINKKYPNLSRGIYKKKGKYVDGVYNQDFSSNCILIEFGGNENTIDEVYNSAIAVGEILSEYIGANNNE